MGTLVAREVRRLLLVDCIREKEGRLATYSLDGDVMGDIEDTRAWPSAGRSGAMVSLPCYITRERGRQ